MPIYKKSIWQQISNPRETYTDGYGTQREVYEPEYVTKGRDIYNKGRDVYQTVHGWLNPGENLQLTDPETGESYKVNANSGAGILMDVIDPAGVIGKVDDVAKLAKNLDGVKDAYRKALLHIKNRRRVSDHELDMAIKGKRVGGMNYALDIMEDMPGTKSQKRAAAQYNAAKKAGDVEKTNALEKELRKLTRKDFYDPYVDADAWDWRVQTIINSPYNGGTRNRFEIPEINYLQPVQLDDIPW